MSGSTGWGSMPNLGAMTGAGGGISDLYAQQQLANMTPEQQQQYRQQMYAKALMGQSSNQPQRSGWGAVSNAMNPILGAAMMANAQPGQTRPAWNPNNPVGTETLGGPTANQGSWLGNKISSWLG